MRNSLNAKMRVMMIEWIAGLVCGAVRSRTGGPVEQVVAAGGCCNMDTVEIYDLKSNTWTKG